MKRIAGSDASSVVAFLQACTSEAFGLIHGVSLINLSVNDEGFYCLGRNLEETKSTLRRMHPEAFESTGESAPRGSMLTIAAPEPEVIGPFLNACPSEALNWVRRISLLNSKGQFSRDCLEISAPGAEAIKIFLGNFPLGALKPVQRLTLNTVGKIHSYNDQPAVIRKQDGPETREWWYNGVKAIRFRQSSPQFYPTPLI